MMFLLWYAEEAYVDNIFVEDQSTRQEADGKAKMAEKFYHMIKDISE